jgi:hypothetical protein
LILNGRSPFDQVAQYRSALIQMTFIPGDAEGAMGRLQDVGFRRLFAFVFLAGSCLGSNGLRAQVSVTVDWSHPVRWVKTTLTIQECPEPQLMPGHPLHAAAMAHLRDLKADMARIQFWHPYPRLGAPELFAPEVGRTFWDFSLTSSTRI